MCGEATGLEGLGAVITGTPPSQGVFTLPTPSGEAAGQREGPGPGGEAGERRQSRWGPPLGWAGPDSSPPGFLPRLPPPWTRGSQVCEMFPKQLALVTTGPLQVAGSVCSLSGRQVALRPTRCEGGQPRLLLGSWGRPELNPHFSRWHQGPEK